MWGRPFRRLFRGLFKRSRAGGRGGGGTGPCDRRGCVGCGVCSLVCPVSAVVMREDREGFLYPVIDGGKCVSCGKCAEACPVSSPAGVPRDPSPVYYGARAADPAEVRTSTSGGVAAALSRQILRAGGVVFGAAFSPFPELRHIRVEGEGDLGRLKGSKYLESDIRGVLPSVREELENGREVLFIGLPCHVAALYSYLGGDRPGLLTVDLLCHGKPPQKLFSRWIRSLRRGGDVRDYRFRTKERCAWDSPLTHTHSYLSGDGWREVPPPENWYGRHFLGGGVFRRCCYPCRFASPPRAGDITLGDFWGAGGDARFDGWRERGISAVSVQSEKGRAAWARAAGAVERLPVAARFALRANRTFHTSPSRNAYRPFVYKYLYLPGFLMKACDLFLCALGRAARRLAGKRRG